jgi:hypothetical protein
LKPGAYTTGTRLLGRRVFASEKNAKISCLQRFAAERFGDEIGRAFVGAELEDGDDVGMIERGGGAGFLFERRRWSGSEEELGRISMATSRSSWGSRAR